MNQQQKLLSKHQKIAEKMPLGVFSAIFFYVLIEAAKSP